MFRGNNDDEFEFDGGFDFDKEEALYKELETLIHSENTAPSMMFPLEDATHVHSGDSDSDGGSDNNKLQVFELENSLVQLPPKLSSLSVPPPTESMLPHTQFHGGFDEWDDTLVYLPPIEETLDQLENTAPRLLSPSAEETLDHLLSLSTPMLLQELLESKNTAPAPSLLPLSTPMFRQGTSPFFHRHRQRTDPPLHRHHHLTIAATDGPMKNTCYFFKGLQSMAREIGRILQGMLLRLEPQPKLLVMPKNTFFICEPQTKREKERAFMTRPCKIKFHHLTNIGFCLQILQHTDILPSHITWLMKKDLIFIFSCSAESIFIQSSLFVSLL
ncbi:uncharacterized protein LOC114401694 [Glycine soja]|uniref:uncharacterized protein LOC114401694 n=1 Tax=Glycine soja TaxID=3848 RepID=UPI00103C4613|nr:uncharacterized protein LOC114401694 [Glycine soja]